MSDAIVVVMIALVALAAAPSLAQSAPPNAQGEAGTTIAQPTTTTTQPPVEMTALERHRRGKAQYDNGECPGAVETLSPLAVPGQLQDPRLQVDVHLMLGVCYVLANKELEASREFSSLLAIEPDYAPDAFYVPPKAIEVFDKQKAAMKAQLDEIRRAREQAKASGLTGDSAILVETTTTTRTVPIAAAFLPFGLAQSANGENVKAVVVGSLQGAFLTANVALFWASVGMLELGNPEFERVGDSLNTEEKVNTYNGLVIANLAAAVVFAGIYGYGVADALWNREDGAVVEKKQTKRALTPEDAKKLGKIPTAPGAP